MSDDVTFADHIASERERLTNARDLVETARRESLSRWDAQLAEIDREFAAIDAYEAAKTEKANPAKNGTARRVRRGSRREAILTVLGAAPIGMPRGEILDALGVKGDKGGEMTVSNALTVLQRAGRVTRQDNGRWAIVAQMADAA